MSEATATTADARSAELALSDHLGNRVRAPWFVATYSGIDRESNRPVITVYASDWAAGSEWAKGQGGRWGDFRLNVVEWDGNR